VIAFATIATLVLATVGFCAYYLRSSGSEPDTPASRRRRRGSSTATGSSALVDHTWFGARAGGWDHAGGAGHHSGGGWDGGGDGGCSGDGGGGGSW